MQESKYIQLIHKKITGIINTEENLALSEWLAKSPNHQKTFVDLEQAWQLSEHYDKSFTPNVDLALLKLKKRIQTESHRAVTERKAKSATLSTLSNKTPRSPRKLYRYAIAASIAVLLGIGLWNALSPSNIFDQQKLTLSSMDKSEFVEMEDGSKVWLNRHSQLSYLKEFGSHQRVVKLEGEAFFDIAKESSRYFVIETAATKIKVLGTSFNVSANPTKGETTVIVKTGKVRFENLTTGAAVELVANEKATYDHNSKTFKTTKNKSPNSLAWMSKELNFRKTPFPDLVTDLENYYGIEIDWKDSNLKDCSYTSLFNDSSLEDIWTALETSFEIKIQRKNVKSFKFVGGSCK
ncbi:MAG: FecR family protein [Saprospiraceae bacterium]